VAPPKPSPVIKLVACDVDGTLLDSARRVPEPNRAAIAALRARGIAFVLCTGRPPRAIRALWEEIGLTEPVVAYNGAVIWDVRAWAACWEAPIPGDTLLAAIGCARATVPGAVLSIEAMDHWWTDRLLAPRADGAFRSPPDGEGPVEGFARGRSAHKLLFFAEADAYVRFTAAMPAGLRATRNRGGLVEVQSAAAAKSTAVARLAQPSEVLALGDDHNDLDLLRWAGDSAAPADATPEALAAARRVVAASDAGSVADAVRLLVAGG